LGVQYIITMCEGVYRGWTADCCDQKATWRWWWRARSESPGVERQKACIQLLYLFRADHAAGQLRAFLHAMQ